MILFGLRDVGSANACLPVIKILKDQRVFVSVYAEGAVAERFKGQIEFVTGLTMDSLLDLVKPSLVVVTCAVVGGAVPLGLAREAKNRNLPVVFIDEMWAGFGAFEWDIFPDGVCVCDEYAKELILKSWTGYLETGIHVTGSPVFDKFHRTWPEAAKDKLRKNLRLKKKWPVVFFPGQIDGMVEAISVLVEALNRGDRPAYLIQRDHPRITFSGASDSNKIIYAEYKEKLKTLKLGEVIDSSKLTSDEVLAGSDIVVGIYSTMTVEACYLRKPVIKVCKLKISPLQRYF